MSESNNPAAAGTADDELSYDEAADLISSQSEPGEPSEEDQATADTPDDEDDESKAQETADESQDEADEDDRPEWDKDGEDGENAKAAGRYASPKDKVKLEDGSEIPIQELIQGNMRQADYTRKTQEVAAHRHAIEQQIAGAQQFAQQLAQQQELILHAAARLLPPKPTAQDFEHDPVGAGIANARYEEAVHELQSLQQSMQGIYQQQTHQQQQTEWVHRQQRQQHELDALLRSMPVLRDPKKSHAFVSDMVSGLGQYYGFQPQEVSELVDHRYALMAADAIRYRRLQANRDGAAKKAGQHRSQHKSAPITKSGRRVSPAEMQSSTAAKLEAKLKNPRGITTDDAADILVARAAAAAQRRR